MEQIGKPYRKGKMTGEQMVAKLMEIAEADLKRKGDDEPLFLCRECLDTKFVTRESTTHGHPGTHMVGTPCPHCPAGREIIEARGRVENRREHREDAGESKVFRPIFRRMCLQFGKQPTPDLLEAYWAELGDFTAQQIERGVKHASRKCKYMPRIADILDGINGPPI